MVNITTKDNIKYLVLYKTDLLIEKSENLTPRDFTSNCRKSFETAHVVVFVNEHDEFNVMKNRRNTIIDKELILKYKPHDKLVSNYAIIPRKIIDVEQTTEQTIDEGV